MSVSIFLDGEEYISASRASEKIGYTSDYIGQLCRAKKIPGKLVGRTWYVNLSSLVEHKEEHHFEKTRKQLTNEFPGSPIRGKIAEITMPVSSKNVVFTYEKDDGPRLPELSKKDCYVEPIWTSALTKQAAAFSLALLIPISASFAILEHTNPSVAVEVQQKIENVQDVGKQFWATVPLDIARSEQLAAASFFSGIDKFFDSVVAGFRSLKDIALNKFFFARAPATVTKTPPPEPLAVTAATKPLDLTSLKNELKTELESYIRVQIESLRAPIVVYSSPSVVAAADLATFLNNQVIPAIYYSVTNQSNSDINHTSVNLSRLTDGGTFTNASISNSTFSGSVVSADSLTFGAATGTSATTTNLFSTTGTFDTLCLSADTCETTWPGADSGIFAWTPTSYGVSTSTTLGFLNGFLSTASSTIDSNLTVTGTLGIGTTSPMEKFTVSGGSIFQVGGDAVNNYTPTELGGAEVGARIGVSSSGAAGHPIAISGSYAYIVNDTVAGTCSSMDATGCEFRIYNVSSSTPNFVGGIDIGGGGNSVAVAGNFAYVTHANTALNEFQVYDISNPQSPTLVGGLEVGSALRDVQIQGRYAYITKSGGAGNEFRIVDISDPRNPVELGGINNVSGFWYSVAVSGRYAYLAGLLGADPAGNNTSFLVVDISNPALPVTVGGVYGGTGTAYSVAVSGSYAYVVMNEASTDEDFIIYDISNPAAPATTTTVALGNTQATNIHVSGRYAYIGRNSSTGILIFDIADVRNPIQVGSIPLLGSASPVGAYAVTRGNRIYAGGSVQAGNEFRVYDLTGIEAQSMLAHSFEAGQATVRNNLLVGQGLFSSSLNVGLGGISSMGPLSVMVASTTSVGNTVASFIGGNVGIGTSTPFSTLQIASSSGAQLTLSDPSTLTNSHWSFRNAGGNFYLATSSPSTFATSSTPALTIIGSTGNIGISSTTPMERLTVTGGSIFQAGGDSTSSSTLVELSGTEIGASVGSTQGGHPIAVSDGYAYTVNASVAGTCSTSDATGCEFRIYSIASSTPGFISGVDFGGNAHSVAVSGSYAYVSHANTAVNTFQIYDVSNPKNPTLVGGLNIGKAVRDIVIAGRYAYITTNNGTGNEFRIIDISDPRNPVELGGLNNGSATFHSIAVSGRYAYLAAQLGTDAQGNAASFVVVDISNPSSPNIVGGVRGGSGIAYNVAVSGSYAYVVMDEGGSSEDFIIYDISNPTSPATTTTVSLGTAQAVSIHVAGRYAYIGRNAGLLMYDVANPRSPVLISSKSVSAGSPLAAYVTIKSNRMYVGLGTQAGTELRIYDLTGIEAQSILAHSFEASQAQVTNSLIVGQGIFSSSLNVGFGGILSNGPLSVFTASTTAASPISASFMGGSVGVGTSSPWGKLSVAGSAGGTIPLFTISSSTSAFATSTVFHIDSNGKVGVATTSPWRTLSVKGTVGFDGLTSSATGNAVCITANKEITDAGGGTCTPSSAEFKENIGDFTELALDEISLLNVTSFQYKGTFGEMRPGEQIGFIAEEVALVDPRLVSFDKEGKPLGLHLDKFMALSVKAIQELNLNLESIASSTASSSPASQSFAERFFGNLFSRMEGWFADAANGIGDFFANRVRTKELCVSDDSGSETCIMKSQLDALLANAAVSGGSGIVSAPVSEPEPTASSTESTATSTSAAPVEESAEDTPDETISLPEPTSSSTEPVITDAPPVTAVEPTEEVAEEPATDVAEESVSLPAPEPEPVSEPALEPDGN